MLLIIAFFIPRSGLFSGFIQFLIIQSLADSMLYRFNTAGKAKAEWAPVHPNARTQD